MWERQRQSLWEAKEDTVDSLCGSCRNRPLTGVTLATEQQTSHPRRIGESGTLLWSPPTNHSSILPTQGSDNPALLNPADEHPSARYPLLNLLGNMARGQGAHEGTASSKQGKDSAGVGRVPSTLPSLGQAPVKHSRPQQTGPLCRSPQNARVSPPFLNGGSALGRSWEEGGGLFSHLGLNTSAQLHPPVFREPGIHLLGPSQFEGSLKSGSPLPQSQWDITV